MARAASGLKAQDKMHRFQVSAAQVAGWLVGALGGLVAIRWVFQVDAIAALIPGSAQMGIVNPLLFVADGVCLVTLAGRTASSEWRLRIGAVCIAALIVFPLAYLFETLTGIALGVDFVRANSLPSPGSLHPGRLSPNASLAFLASGIGFAALWPRPSPARRRLYLGMTLVVAIVGVGAAAGYFLGLESLYQLASFNRLLPGTAFGLSALAAGMWLLHQDGEAFNPAALASSERRIEHRSWVVITLVALAGGVAGFAALRETFEQSLSQNLLLIATTNATSMANAIEAGLGFPRTVSTRPTVRQTLDRLTKAPDDAQAKDYLQKIADSFLTAGLSGADFFDANGRLQAHAGTLVRAQAQAVSPLQNAGQTAFLAWQGGYVLAAENEVTVDQQVVGRVVTEQRLPLLDALLAEVRGANSSSDAVICHRGEDLSVCGPSRLRPAGFKAPIFDAAGNPGLPVARALRGEKGVLFANDQRGINVLSAFAPIQPFGLALGVNTDVHTLYAPLRSKLNLLALSMLGIVALGIYAQRSQVRPLLRRLVDSEQKLKSILEDQSELVSLARANGELTYVNPAYARHFNLAPRDMIGGNLFDHVEPAHRDAVRQQLAQVLATGATATGENLMVSLDGSERWVAWTNSLQRDSSGQPMLHSVGRDATARKHAELALRTSQAFLARTGRVAGVGGWELDLASNALTWSDETRRIHEVPDDFVPSVGRAIAFYAAEARPVIEAAVSVGIERGQPWDLELPMVTAKGRRIWVRAQGEAEYGQGSPVRLIGALQDITQRKLLEQRIAESERFLRLVTDGLPVGIAYVDHETRLQFVNANLCRRLGLPREAILGCTRAELTEGATGREIEQRLRAALLGQEQRFEFDEVVDGKPRHIENRLVPDRADDGKIRGVISTAIDITERVAGERSLRELTVIFDNTPDYVVQTDFRGTITYINPAARELMALGDDDLNAGRNFSEFNTPQTNRRFAEEIVPTVKVKGAWVGETTVYGAGRQVMPVSHMVIAHRDSSGRVARYSAIMRDISAEVQAKEQERRQAATLRSVTEAIPAIVAVVGADGRYRFVNSGFERWCGAPRDAIVGRALIEILGRGEYERSRPWIDKVLAGESVNFEKEYAGNVAARHLAISYIPLWLDSGVVDGFVGVAQDITQHKHEEVRLLQLAQRDALTGLLNRSGFEQYLEAKLRAGVESGSALALLYVDLDHFKPVNDTHGHPVGDAVLQLFAQRLQRVVRPTDAVARLGGDEFAIALAGVREEANAQAVGEKVLAAAKAPFEVGSLTLAIGASVGVAIGADPAVGWQELVARADAMLYQAKSAGRGRLAGVSGLVPLS